jgi:RND family efflux transporter MFP subunit
MSRKKLRFVMPVVVVLVGVAAAVLLASARKVPPRVERISLGPLVEVVEVSSRDVPMAVVGHGEVVPKVAVDVIPQVAGQVVEIHRSLVSGGFFSAGETLFVIDPRDYELAVNRSEAAVARAEVTLERERAEADVALQEWDAINPGEEPTSGLVVREPQVRQAEAELEAARADLAVARLKLERTRVSVPFDGVVVSKSVDLGQFVSIGKMAARVYGTDKVEVRVPLENRELAWFDIPRSNGGGGPVVEVGASFAGETHTWEGRVVRMEAQVDAGSRMIHVVVEVGQPYARHGNRPPLLPGTFVDVRVFGKTVANQIPVPRHALHEGGHVWVAKDGTLNVRRVEITRSDREYAYVASGLEDGALVVVTALDAVTDGMKVRVVGDGEAEPSTGPSDDDTIVFFDYGLRIEDYGFPPTQPGAGDTHTEFGIRNSEFGNRRTLPGRVVASLQPATRNLQPGVRAGANPQSSIRNPQSQWVGVLS